jgi:hypothetical protein
MNSFFLHNKDNVGHVVGTFKKSILTFRK